MPTHQSRHIKRTNLFLVRVWTEGDAQGTGNSNSNSKWHGRVQRVVDGESHRFDNLQGLIDLLQEMLSAAGGEQL